MTSVRPAAVLVPLLALVVACGGPTPSPSGSTPVAAGPSSSAERPDATQGPTGTADPPPDPTTAPGSSPGPVPGPPDDSIAGRILAAQASGELDGPTALLYRIYAINGDDRLPAEFAGGVPGEDLAGVKEAVASFAALPAAIQADIRPFIVRPTDPGSAYHGSDVVGSGGGITLARAVAPVAALPCSLLNWAHQDGSNPFRVWGNCGRAREAEIGQVVAELDRLWPKMVRVMRQPLPDGGTDDEGGSPAIDIYLVDPCKWRGTECHGVSGNTLAEAIPAGPYEGDPGSRRSSGFIIVGRSALANPVRARATIAHELFHVMQSAFNEDVQYVPGAGLHWFVEASAKWSEWAFVPEAAGTEVIPWFDVFEESPFGLQAPVKRYQYAAYAWPLFMQQAGGGADAVGSAWRGAIFATSEAELTDAIDDVVPFAPRFRDFAVRAWNERLDKAIDPLFPLQAVGDPRVRPVPPRRGDNELLLPFAPGAPPLDHTEFLGSLYSVYRPFQVDPTVRQLTIDTSGLGPATALDVDALVRVKGKGWERRKLRNGATRWCLDQPKDDIEEGIIVLSNHAKDPNTRIVGNWTFEPLDASCALLQGTLTFERTSTYLEDEPYLPRETHDEHTTAKVHVMMRGEDTGTGDRTLLGLQDAVDPRRPRKEDGSRYSVESTTLATKELGDCTARFGTQAKGDGRFADQPLGPDYVNGISGFLDYTGKQMVLSVVVHYRFGVREDVCNLTSPTVFISSDVFICPGQFGIVGKLEEVDGGPDQIRVDCTGELQGMGYDKQTITISGTLTLFDE